MRSGGRVGLEGLPHGDHRRDVVDLQPQAVHILAGTNDVYPGWQLSDTANNMQTMVEKAKKHHIAVVIGTIPPWGPGALPERADPSPQRFQRIDQLNQWLMQFAADEGIQIVDYHSLLVAAYAVMTPHTEQAIQAALAAPR